MDEIKSGFDINKLAFLVPIQDVISFRSDNMCLVTGFVLTGSIEAEKEVLVSTKTSEGTMKGYCASIKVNNQLVSKAVKGQSCEITLTHVLVNLISHGDALFLPSNNKDIAQEN